MVLPAVFLKKDLMLYLHVVLGLLTAVLAFLVLLYLKKGKPETLKLLSGLAALASWVSLLPAAITYLVFYPATKTVIKAGGWPWAHSIVMETKEHWGLLLPLITTVAAGLVFQGKAKESKKWWLLLIALVLLIGVMGRLVKMGALQR